jgi:hypothetical protein
MQKKLDWERWNINLFKLIICNGKFYLLDKEFEDDDVLTKEEVKEIILRCIQ